MNRYHKIYEEEGEEDDCGIPDDIPGVSIRYPRYGIWGHSLSDLILHTLYVHSDGIYSIGIDS